MRLVKLEFKPRAKGSRRAISRAMDQIVDEMNTAIHRGLDTPYPPPSRPGAKPHLRTGRLYRQTQVVRKGTEIQVRTTQYGIWLESGTSKMKPRPFIRRVIHARKRDWSKKLTQRIRAQDKG